MNALSPSTKINTGLILTIALLALCLVWYKLFVFSTGIKLPMSQIFLIGRVLQWLLLGFICWYAYKIEKQTLLIWAQQKHNFVFTFLSVLVMFMVILVGSALVYLTLKPFGLSKQTTALAMLRQFNVPLKFLGISTAAVVEELVCRGYLMPRLQTYFKNVYWPVIITSVIFGLAHFGYGTVINMAIPFFIGLVFALHYQKYRDIKIVIACHFLIDFIALFAK